MGLTSQVLATGSLILGAVGLTLTALHGMWQRTEPPYWPLALGVAGFALSVVARRNRAAPFGMAVTGLAVFFGVNSVHLHTPRWSVNQVKAEAAVHFMRSAQAAYADENGGYYEGDAACLTVSGGCIPGEPEGQWVSAATEANVGTGYVRELHVGPAPRPDEIERAGASPSSVRSFAYYVRPLVPAGTGILPAKGFTGVLAFCVDSAATMCSWQPDQGSLPPLQNGRCEIGPTDVGANGWAACQPPRVTP